MTLSDRLSFAKLLASDHTLLGVPFTETSHTAYIRMCLQGGDVESAEASLKLAEANPAVKKVSHIRNLLSTLFFFLISLFTHCAPHSATGSSTPSSPTTV